MKIIRPEPSRPGPLRYPEEPLYTRLYKLRILYSGLFCNLFQEPNLFFLDTHQRVLHSCGVDA